MATNLVQDGRVITTAAPAAVTSGEIVLLGSIPAVAIAAAESGEQVAFYTEGVFSLPCAAADDIGVGDALYLDAVAGVLTKTAGGNTYVGVAYGAAGVGVASVAAKINHAPRTAQDAETPSEVVVQARIADADETAPAYAVAPIAGTIVKIYSVVQPDATGVAQVAAETVLTTQIGATPITDGAITIASASPVGAMDEATPSAANVVAEGDVLSVASDGADTADHPVEVIFVIQPA